MIKLYGKKSGCGNCNIAKSMLDRNNIEYSFIDVTENEEELELIKSLGYKQLPVIENEEDWYTLKTLDDLLFTLGY